MILNEVLFRAKEAVSMQSCLKKISCNQEREDRLWDNYGKGLVSILWKRKKSAQKLEKEVFKTYNITAF